MALLAATVMLGAMPAVGARAAARAGGTTSGGPRIISVETHEDSNFDVGSLLGTLGGAAVGGLAAIFGGIKTAQLRERRTREQEHRQSAEHERRRQAADTRRLVQLCTDTVAALGPFQLADSLDEIDAEVRRRTEAVIIEAGGIQPFIRDQDLKLLAKKLLEGAATVVANDSPPVGVRRDMIETVKDHQRDVQTRASQVWDELATEDTAAEAAQVKRRFT